MASIIQEIVSTKFVFSVKILGKAICSRLEDGKFDAYI